MYERAEARIDLEALKHNCAELRRRIGPGVELAPVLKADGYGHGAAHCAAAAIDGRGRPDRGRNRPRGAADPGARPGGPDPGPRGTGAGGGRGGGRRPGPTSRSGTRISSRRWTPRRGRRDRVTGVHVKYDTGMGRLGSTSIPKWSWRRRGRWRPARTCSLEALWTHFATADEADTCLHGPPARAAVRAGAEGPVRISRA